MPMLLGRQTPLEETVIPTPDFVLTQINGSGSLLPGGAGKRGLLTGEEQVLRDQPSVAQSPTCSDEVSCWLRVVETVA
jgi:hypothetical protein